MARRIVAALALVVAITACSNSGSDDAGGSHSVTAKSCNGEATHTGDATYYDFADGSGNCGFDPTPNDLMVGAMNQTDYAGSNACGSCAHLVGPEGEITIRIVDRCPECKPGDIDLSPDAFAKIAAIEKGRVDISWRYVPCSVSGPIRAAVSAIKPDIRIAINTLPFFLEDFGNAVEEVFGQSVTRLEPVSDVFEVMSYHQILRRDAAWPGAVGADIKRRANGATTVCTVQGSALYLDGMHAGRGRAEEITTDEFIRSVDGVEASDVDGLCVFTFTDFLNMRGTSDGERRIDRLKAFRR